MDIFYEVNRGVIVRGEFNVSAIRAPAIEFCAIYTDGGCSICVRGYILISNRCIIRRDAFGAGVHPLSNLYNIVL